MVECFVAWDDESLVLAIESLKSGGLDFSVEGYSIFVSEYDYAFARSNLPPVKKEQ